ncbi:unnamed protein product [Cylicocyclus nassatus]|uniref:Regulatory protein zeste n=1 Tax=Cylicocyclus nassatus TaxID=53992 RepID=A0AA36DI80_CYLNA|nr:unnamed protein product [Cylicocyclus nassatus]
MSQAKKPRVSRSTAYTDEESQRLITLYIENRDKYHEKFKSGSKNGDSIRQNLLTEWSKDISSLGVAFRSKESIEEKIKNESKKVQKFLREEKEKYTGTGGGVYNLHKLPEYLRPLVDCLAEKHHVTGVPGLDGDSDDDFECTAANSSASEGLEMDMSGREDLTAEDQPDASGECTQSTMTSESAPALSKSRSVAAKAREALTLFTDKRSLLYEEEIKLARLKQRKVQVEIQIAELKLEEAKLQLKSANQGIAPQSPISSTYPQYFNL